MISPAAYYALLTGWALLALVVFGTLWRLPAPYGRFARPGWGPTLPARWSWLLMESPAVIVVTGLFVSSPRASLATLGFCLIWNLHYVYRSLVYPWLLHSRRRVPLMVTASGATFNVINGYLQAGCLFYLAEYPETWCRDARFWLGLGLFCSGLVVNVHSDWLLRRLRREGGPEYRLPQGGLFRWVSCPNYFGELLEWTGWAVLTWSWSGAAFVLWTAANLVPRAMASHAWYFATFPDYPRRRRAIIPWIL